MKLQVVFGDTPGVVSREDADKYKLEESMVSAPERGCDEADLILVVQDVSNRYVREALNKDILRLLCRHAGVPAVLVLNKMDTIPASRRVYDLIRKLTCNRLEGERAEVRVADLTHLRTRHTPESYLKARERRRTRKEEVKMFVAKLEVSLYGKFYN